MPSHDSRLCDRQRDDTLTGDRRSPDRRRARRVTHNVTQRVTRPGQGTITARPRSATHDRRELAIALRDTTKEPTRNDTHFPVGRLNLYAEARRVSRSPPDAAGPRTPIFQGSFRSRARCVVTQHRELQQSNVCRMSEMTPPKIQSETSPPLVSDPSHQ